LDFAKEHGCTSPILEFKPDAAFACDLYNDTVANAFMKKNGSEAEKFLCCIPRYRHTPYWEIKPWVKYSEKHDTKNQSMKESDHLPLRESIIRVVRETGYKVLVCPEDQTQVSLGLEMLYDPLPEDVKKKVVWLDHFWKVDFANSIYRKSAGIFGLEMHSPILCIGNGIPAIVGRFKEQTTKGFMWDDIGLSEWLFDFDVQSEVEKYPETVLSLINDRENSLIKTQQARSKVETLQRDSMEVLRANLFAF